MSDYYENCLKQIKNHILEGQLSQAQSLIEEELRMPYIPQEVENNLLDLLKECRGNTPRKPLLDDEQLVASLLGDEESQLMAISQLKEMNLRKYRDLIQEALDHAQSRFIQALLIELCIDQQIQDELTVRKEGLEISFIPMTCESPMESDGVKQCVQYLSQWLENENPSLLKLCIETCVQEAYLQLPFGIDEDESEDLAVAVCQYVGELMGMKDEMNSILCEKKVAQKGQFELLLYSNNL